MNFIELYNYGRKEKNAVAAETKNRNLKPERNIPE